MINEQMPPLVTGEKKLTDISFCFDVSDVYGDFGESGSDISYTIFWFSKKKIASKQVSISDLESELNSKKKVKMVMILVQNAQKEQIYDALSEISRKKGICSPIIELENAILYFPELRYSDLGLLAFLCEQKVNIKKYNLSMTSCRLIGGRCV